MSEFEEKFVNACNAVSLNGGACLVLSPATIPLGKFFGKAAAAGLTAAGYPMDAETGSALGGTIALLAPAIPTEIFRKTAILPLFQCAF